MSAGAGGFATWHLGRRHATEIEDALGWAIGSGIAAGLVPLVLLIVMVSGAE